MSQKSGTQKASAEAVIKDIRRATRKQYGAEEKRSASCSRGYAARN